MYMCRPDKCKEFDGFKHLTWCEEGKPCGGQCDCQPAAGVKLCKKYDELYAEVKLLKKKLKKKEALLKKVGDEWFAIQQQEDFEDSLL